MTRRERHILRTTRAPGLGNLSRMRHQPLATSIEAAFGHRHDVRTQSRHRDELIGCLAGEQHGVVTRRQLLDLGIRRGALARRVEHGRLVAVSRGVYAVGHAVLTREGKWSAAVLAGGEGAVLSHRSAAALWGLSASAPSVEITTPRATRSTAAIRRHCAALPGDEVTEVDGIPVTGPHRTILDLAAVLSARSVERAIRETEYLRLPDRLSLPDLLARHPGSRGARAIRECLARCAETPSGLTRSELEDRFVDALLAAGLPPPELNASLEVDTGRLEVDCLWRAQQLVVELDGRRAHGTRAAFESDRARDRNLQAAGWTVVRITWRQLHDARGEVIADLRRLLAGTLG